MHARLKAMYYSTIMPHAPPNARGVHTIGTPAGSWSVRVHAANTGMTFSITTQGKRNNARLGGRELTLLYICGFIH